MPAIPTGIGLMSLIELGKSLHGYETDLACGRRIVFHHVPKCGGTSVGARGAGSRRLEGPLADGS